MKLSNLFLVLLAAFALGFSACSSDDSTSTDTTTTTAVIWDKTDGAGATCLVESNTSPVNYYAAYWTIDGTSIGETWISYGTDSTCATASAAWQRGESGTLANQTDTSLDITFTTVTLTILNDAGMTDRGSYCSLTWVLDVAQEVTTCPEVEADNGTYPVTYTGIPHSLSADGTTWTWMGGTSDEMVLVKR